MALYRTSRCFRHNHWSAHWYCSFLRSSISELLFFKWRPHYINPVADLPYFAMPRKPISVCPELNIYNADLQFLKNQTFWLILYTVSFNHICGGILEWRKVCGFTRRLSDAFQKNVHFKERSSKSVQIIQIIIHNLQRRHV